MRGAAAAMTTARAVAITTTAVVVVVVVNPRTGPARDRRRLSDRDGTQTERPAVLQQAEKDVDATVQGLPAAVHSVPVQQHRHHMPGGRLHHSRRLYVHIHRGPVQQHQSDRREGHRQPDRHREPAVGADLLQRVLRAGVARQGAAAPQVVPELHHRGRPQFQLRRRQQGDEPMVVLRLVPLLAVRHHHHR